MLKVYGIKMKLRYYQRLEIITTTFVLDQIGVRPRAPVCTFANVYYRARLVKCLRCARENQSIKIMYQWHILNLSFYFNSQQTDKSTSIVWIQTWLLWELLPGRGINSMNIGIMALEATDRGKHFSSKKTRSRSPKANRAVMRSHWANVPVCLSNSFHVCASFIFSFLHNVVSQIFRAAIKLKTHQRILGSAFQARWVSTFSRFGA